ERAAVPGLDGGDPAGWWFRQPAARHQLAPCEQPHESLPDRLRRPGCLGLGARVGLKAGSVWPVRQNTVQGWLPIDSRRPIRLRTEEKVADKRDRAVLDWQ